MLRNKYFKCGRTRLLWEQYRKSRNLVTKLKAKSMADYFSHRCSAQHLKKNPSKFWDTIQPFMTNKSKSCNENITLVKLGTIQTMFVIYLMVILQMWLFVAFSSWIEKKSDKSLLYKGHNNLEPQNYRPLRVLTFLSKIFGSIMIKWVCILKIYCLHYYLQFVNATGVPTCWQNWWKTSNKHLMKMKMLDLFC